MLKNIKDINSLINYQENPHIKEINALKIYSSNFSNFIDNFWIIKRLYEEENIKIEFTIIGLGCRNEIFCYKLINILNIKHK